MILSIGSGNIHSLMMRVDTKGFQDFFRLFVSDTPPYYNAIASPIDACRIGAILEDRYLQILSEDYYTQYKVRCKEMDVFASSLDFAKIDNGKVVDFDELKTLFLPDFIEIIEPLRVSEEKEYLPIIKNKFSKYYDQIQAQLMCSDLEEANLVFLAVESYDDEENQYRNIKENDYCKFRIKKDKNRIFEIQKKGEIFQKIKNYMNEN